METLQQQQSPLTTIDGKAPHIGNSLTGEQLQALPSEKQKAAFEIALHHTIPIAESFVYDIAHIDQHGTEEKRRKANSLLRAKTFFRDTCAVTNIAFFYEARGTQPGLAMALYKKVIEHYSGR